MFHLSREIYSVGFGAYCAERFRWKANGSADSHWFNIVYDCGTKKGRSNIITNSALVKKDQIDPEFHVDILFISHFHEDHINCIKHLNLDSNSIVVLPYLFDENYYNVIETVCEIEGYVQLLSDLQKDKHVNFLFVRPETDEKEYQPHNENQEYKPLRFANNDNESDFNSPIRIPAISHVEYNQNNLRGLIVPSSTPLLYFDENKEPLWEFIPVHIFGKDYFTNIANEFHKNGITGQQLNSYDGTDSNLKHKIHKVYSNVFGSDKLNLSTMLLLSRASKPNKHLDEVWYNNTVRVLSLFHSRNDASCLYTGDLELNIKDIKTRFVKSINIVLDNRGCEVVQLPHHGSKNGYDVCLYECTNPTVTFVNFCSRPTKSQPTLCNDSVVEALNRGILFYGVSEDSNDVFLSFNYH